jgi:sulfhydrogenase subunit beta (sulfur reductase)
MKKEKESCVILERKDIDTFFTSLLKTYRIVGPSVLNDEDKFVEIDSANKINFDYDNTKMSPKNFFFPQTENLLAFDADTDVIKESDTEADSQIRPQILFGVRPCDALSISFLDKVFNEMEPSDFYYTRRRNSTCIISLMCSNPRPTCFCTSIGCGPDSETGADITFTKLDGNYLIKALTSKGKEILVTTKEILRPATEHEVEEKAKLMELVKNKLEKVFEIDDLKNKLDDFDAPYWNTLHRKCLGCGICTFFCPTCHCFDITDEVFKNLSKRVRTWDSCMFPLFSLHASGHNPRPTHRERMRQRIMHKFNYAPRIFGQIFCVGCGRCIIECPVNMDIRQMITGILEEK